MRPVVGFPLTQCLPAHKIVQEPRAIVMTTCPRTKFSDDSSLGQCVPWSTWPLEDACPLEVTSLTDRYFMSRPWTISRHLRAWQASLGYVIGTGTSTKGSITQGTLHPRDQNPRRNVQGHIVGGLVIHRPVTIRDRGGGGGGGGGGDWRESVEKKQYKDV
jgi:hypothetical protein